MKQLLNNFKNWIKENDKIKHFIVCFIGSFLFGYGFGVGAGLAAEYKDMAWGGKWGWCDLLADALGTIIGGLIHIIIF